MPSGGGTSTFGDLFRTAGASFLVSAFVGRLPVAMIVVGVLTLVTTARGSIAAAGLAAAAAGVGAGVGGPLIGAAADRFGQRWVLTISAILNSAAMVVVLLVTYSPVHIIVLTLLCAMVGLTVPQVSSLARARWVGLLENSTDRPSTSAHASAAMSYESMADELSFLFGPVLVGLLASLVRPWFPLAAAALLTLVFVIAFAWHPTVKHAAGHGQRRVGAEPARALLGPRVMVPALGMLAMGTLFGATLTSVGKFMALTGNEEQTGLVYGAMGISSAVLAISVAALPEWWMLRWRWVLSAVVLSLAAAFLPWIASVGWMVVVLLLLGVGVGVTLVTLFSIGVAVAPVGRLTTVMTMLSGGVVVGQALAMAIVGRLAETFGYQVASYGGIIAAAACLVFALINTPLYSRSPRESFTIQK